jgi:hypothetical protein
MTTITQQVATILASNNIGVGKTDTLPQLYSFETETRLSVAGLGEFDISEATQKAELIRLLHNEVKKGNEDNKLNLFKAMAAGYLNPFHQKATEGGATKEVNPLANPKKVLSAEEYRTNCIKLGLDGKNVEVISALLTEVTNVTEKTTKADLLEIVNNFASVFYTSKQQLTFENMLEKELAEAAKFAGLTEAGFTDIKQSLTLITANITASEADTAFPKLVELGYIIEGKPQFDASTMKIQVAFKEVVTV